MPSLLLPPRQIQSFQWLQRGHLWQEDFLFLSFFQKAQITPVYHPATLQKHEPAFYQGALLLALSGQRHPKSTQKQKWKLVTFEEWSPLIKIRRLLTHKSLSHSASFSSDAIFLFFLESQFLNFFFQKILLNFFLAALGLHCCGLFFVTVCGLLTAVAPLASWYVASSQTRDWTHVPCTGK